MRTRTPNTERARRRSDVYGKCACVSFAAFETHLMDDWEKLAEAEYLTKSAYFKRFIRAEARKLKEQQNTDWASMHGGRK